MNLQGVEFINYIYLFVLIIGTWINVSIFSTIQWLAILFYLYNLFCVADRNETYFNNQRFVIVFLISFSNLLMIFHGYILVEYIISDDQEEYYQSLTNLGFDYKSTTNIIYQTSINLTLAFIAFCIGVFIYCQLNVQEDVFKGQLETDEMNQSSPLKAFVRKSTAIQNNIATIQQKYDSAEKILIVIYILLAVLIITIDGIFGVLYCVIISMWFIAKLDQESMQDVGYQITVNKKYLNYLKNYSFFTCYAGIVWKLNVFNTKYRGITLIISGYITESTILYAIIFIVQVFVLMFAIYTKDLLDKVQEYHFQKLQERQAAQNQQSKFFTILSNNYYGLLIFIVLLWIQSVWSILMVIPIILTLIGSIFRKKKGFKLKTAVYINNFGWIFLILNEIFNIPFLFRYITGKVIFNVIGLHSINEEKRGLLGLFERMLYIMISLIIIFAVYYITLLKIKYKQDKRYLSLQSNNLIQYDRTENIQKSEFTNPVLLVTEKEFEESQRIIQDEQEERRQEQKEEEEKRNNEEEEKKENEEEKKENNNQQIKKKRTKSFIMRAQQKLNRKMKAAKTKFVELMEFLMSILVHLEKLIICIIFIVAIQEIDIIHSFYLMAFLAFVFSHMKYWRLIMQIVIFYCYLVIIFKYIINILYLSKVFTEFNDIMKLFGIKDELDMNLFLFQQIILVLIVLILAYYQTNILSKTQVYQKYRQFCINLEDENKTYIEKMQIVKKMDILSRFYIKYGTWICYLNLLIVGLLPPANFLSLIYLLFLQMFISFTLCQGQSAGFQKVMKGWPILVFLSNTILVIRYFCLFSYFNQQLQTFLNENKILEDIGLSLSYNTLQIFGNGFILMFLNAQRRLINAKIYEHEVPSEIKKDTYVPNKQQQNKLYKMQHGTLKNYIYKKKILLKMFLVNHFSKFVMFYGFVLSILHDSISGIIICLVQMIVFIWNRNEFWKSIWIPLWALSFSFLLVQYLVQLHVVGDQITVEEKAWAGLFSINSKEYWIFLILYIIQQILCIILRRLQKVEEDLKTSTYQNYLQKFEYILTNYKSAKQKLNEKVKLQQEQQRRELEESNADDSNNQIEQDYEELIKNLELTEEEQRDYQRYLRWSPYQKAEKAEKNFNEIFKYYGYDFCLFIIIIAAYFEMNAVSLSHIILASFLGIFSYVINCKERYNEKLIIFIQILWRIVNYAMIIDITRKYFIQVWFPQEWNIQYPWSQWNFQCDERGKESFRKSGDLSDFQKCQNDWMHWLSLSEESNIHLVLDIINFQLMVIYDKYLQEIQSQGGPQRVHELIQTQDDHDFTQKNGIKDYIQLFFFGYFYQIALIVYFIIGCLNNISNYTDLISMTYVFVSICMLFKTKLLQKRKNDIWQYLIYFNTSVMCILCLYQCPYFQCPVEYPEGTYYLNADECLQEQNKNRGQFYIQKVVQNDFDKTNDFYILFSHVLGFNKSRQFVFDLSKETMMILFFFFGLIQKNIWNHPYTVFYIDPYFKRQTEQQKTNAVELVVQAHLTRIRAFQKLAVQKDVYDSIQQRVENKVKVWDNKKQEDEDQQLIDKKKQQTEENEAIILAEQIAQSQEDQALELKIIIELCKIYKNQRKELQEALQNEEKTLESENLEKIYSNDYIGVSKYHEILNQIYEIKRKRYQEYLLKEQQRKESLERQQQKKESDEQEQQKQQDSSVLYVSSSNDETEQEHKLKKQKEKQKSSMILRKTKEQIIDFLIDILCRSTKDMNQMDIQQYKIERNLSQVFILSLQHNFYIICFILFILNAIMNSDLISIFYPLSFFLYALLENYFIPRNYWKIIMYYTIAVISLKFLYQLPIFCGSPPYTLFFLNENQQCLAYNVTIEQVRQRIDFFIGIRKYMGPASYPPNQGFFVGIMWDYIVLLALFIQRSLMQIEGKWSYMYLDKDDQYVPQFRDPQEEYNLYKSLPQEEQQDKQFSYQAVSDITLKSQDNQQQQQLEFNENNDDQERVSPPKEKKDRLGTILLFFYRLFPFYLLEKLEQKIVNDKKQRLLKKSSTLEFIKDQDPEILTPNTPKKEEDQTFLKPGKNYYVHQFVTSFIILIYFIIFYPQMIRTSPSGNSRISQQSRFSSEIVIIMIICIAIIVLDRTLYKLRRLQILNQSTLQQMDFFTRNSLLFKLILHIVITIATHIYLFFILTYQTHLRFNESFYLIICYVLICFYLYYSALQIRYGYPLASLGSIFSNNTSFVYRISFIVYRSLPFLYELRSVIDWTFTSTALDLFQWFKMEDAYCNLYSVKADMVVRKEYHQLGKKRPFMEKCQYGCLLLLALLAIILLPIFLFSNLNPAVELNNLTSGTYLIELQVRNVEKEYNIKIFDKGSVQVNDMTDQQFNTFQNTFYGVDDLWKQKMQIIKVDSLSDTSFSINKPIVNDLKQELENENAVIYLQIQWTFRRPKPEGKEVVLGKQDVQMDKEFVQQFKKLISELYDDQNNIKKIPKDSNYQFMLKQFNPIFLYITDGVAALQRSFEPIDKSQLEKYYKDNPSEAFEQLSEEEQMEKMNIMANLDCKLVLKYFEGQFNWFFLRLQNPYLDDIITFDPKQDAVSFMTMSEMAFSSILRAMSDNLSLIGIYLTVVLTIGRFLRLYFDRTSMRCIWEELPNTQDLFDLCESIYIARLENDLMKEEKNYELLIKILRSPEILLRLTGESLYQ